MIRKSIVILLFFGMLFLNIPDTKAQCPMCKTSVESSLKDKSSNKGRGLNKGILYLLSIPYLTVGLIGTGWYINSRKKQNKLR
jgi:hypothetical protein